MRWASMRDQLLTRICLFLVTLLNACFVDLGGSCTLGWVDEEEAGAHNGDMLDGDSHMLDRRVTSLLADSPDGNFLPAMHNVKT